MATDLLAAVKSGCVEGIVRALTGNPLAVSQRDQNQNNALHVAARYGNSGIVRMLMNASCANLYYQNSFGDTPMHVAARFANIEALGVILYADHHGLRTRNVRGNTPLHNAASSTCPEAAEAVRMLLPKAPDIALDVNEEGHIPLHLAVGSSNHGAVLQLARLYPDSVDALNTEGLAPLHVAMTVYVDLWDLSQRDSPSIGNRRRDILAFLLHSTDVDKTFVQMGRTCTGGEDMEPTVLHAAAFMGHTCMARLVLGMDPSAMWVRSLSGDLPIHFAACNGSSDIVQVMLDVDPDIAYESNAHGEKPLHSAAASSSRQTVATLLDVAPGMASELTANGTTPTLAAAAVGNVGGLELLLHVAGHTTDVTDLDGNTPMHAAAWSGQRAAVDMLMRLAPHTARAISSDDGFNAFHVAVSNLYVDVVQTMLEHDPSLAETLTLEGDTALHVALAPDMGEDGGNFKNDDLAACVVSLILRARPSLAWRPGSLRMGLGNLNLEGCVPLHIAAALEMPKCVDELVAAVPETVFCINSLGFTPMRTALIYGHTCGVPRMLSVPGQDPARLLDVLNRFNVDVECPELYVALLEASLPLPPDCWALVPSPLPGLLALLPTTLRLGLPRDIREVVSRMLPLESSLLTTSLGCLRASAPPLPTELVQKIISLSHTV